MRKMRVLVVDDSVVIRRVLTHALSSDPAIEVVGTAPNDRIALAKIAQAHPDLVTLDVEMPEMGGIETLAALRKTNPFMPVIMFSLYTEKGSAATLNALAFGGVDYVTKPAGTAGAEVASKVIREDLLPRIKMRLSAAAGAEAFVSRGASLPPTSSARSTLAGAGQPQSRVDIVVVGISTGGPSALEKFLSCFPADFPVPILIVQHMPPGFTTLLAHRLAAKCKLSVGEVRAMRVLEPGQAWLAPGGRHLVVEGVKGAAQVRISDAPPENSCRPSVDVLFRSAAETFGCHVLGVIMTGMGQDGYRGCEKIREAGGQVWAQDEASSVVWGMPGFVTNAGLVDRVVALNELAPEVARRVMMLRPVPPRACSTPPSK